MLDFYNAFPIGNVGWHCATLNVLGSDSDLHINLSHNVYDKLMHAEIQIS